jgi:hypothetical protein
MRVANLVVVAAVLLQACVMTAPEPQPSPVPVQADLTSCHAVGLDGLIGSPLRLLPNHGRWSTLRVIRPGMMITMDYSATRLNVRVDGNSIILALNCG